MGRWALSSASETLAGSAGLQRLPTTTLSGRQAVIAQLDSNVYFISRPVATFTTCGGALCDLRLPTGQGLGAPTLHDLSHDLRLQNPQPFTTWGGGPPTLRDLIGAAPNPAAFELDGAFKASEAHEPCPHKRGVQVNQEPAGPFGPERALTQTLNVVWTPGNL